MGGCLRNILKILSFEKIKTEKPFSPKLPVNIPKYSRIFRNIKNILKRIPNIQEYSKAFRNIPKCSKIFQNVQEYSKVSLRFENMPEYSKVFRNIPKYS